MDNKEIAERLRYSQNIAAKHGYHSVAASKVYEIFEASVQPAKFSFSAIKAGVYGRVVNDDIVHLLKLQSLKGASYSIWWGVSLSYVPHGWNKGLHWHRGFRASRFDLFETPHDYFSAPTEDWRQSEMCLVQTLYGELYLRETLEGTWKRMDRQVLAWFSSTQSLAGVLQRAHEQVEREWSGPSHHPNPLMVYAFTLGRMGHTDQARAFLDEFFRLSLEPSEAQENLKKALAKICID